MYGGGIHFKGKISSHGGGKYIIYIPKEFSERAKHLYDQGKEVIVIVATEG